MKKNIIALILTCFFFVLSFTVTADTTNPGDPGGQPEAGDPPLGGGAPIGGGTLILIGLGAAYGGKKVLNLFNNNQEELEE